MKINTGQFTETFLPTIDGVSTTVKNYAYWLNEKYGKSIVITPRYPDYKDTEPYEVIRYKSIMNPLKQLNAFGNYQYKHHIKDELSGYPIDIVHSHSPFSSGIAALQFSRDRKIPIVASVHENYYDFPKKFLKMKLLNQSIRKRIIKFYEQVDYVFTFNQNTLDILKENGFKGKADIIENGTDYKWGDELKKDKEYINHLYDIPQNTYVLLYVGQLAIQKNLRLLMVALSYLKQLKQEFRMIFIGEGQAQSEMNKFFEENRLKKNVIFVGQIHDREQLSKYYARADLFLFPSVIDTSSLVIREAASFKTPSLLIKNSMVSSLIKDNYNGYLSENNSLSYAQRIIAVINDRNKEKVRLKSQDTLAKSYEQIVDEIYERYNDIIKYSKQY